MISRWKRNLATYLKFPDVWKPCTTHVCTLTGQTMHRVSGDQVHLCCTVGLCTYNEFNVFAVCWAYCTQAGHLGTSCLVDLLNPGNAGLRSIWCTTYASNFWTWIPPAEEEILPLQAVEAADLGGLVLAIGNISSLYLLEIPSWTAGYWWY